MFENIKADKNTELTLEDLKMIKALLESIVESFQNSWAYDKAFYYRQLAANKDYAIYLVRDDKSYVIIVETPSEVVDFYRHYDGDLCENKLRELIDEIEDAVSQELIRKYEVF